MECKVDRNGNITRVQPVGEIDLAVAPELRLLLQGLLEKGQTRLVMDLRAVTFIDSSGLGILVNAYKLAKQLGGNLKFANASPEVRKLFQITRTDKYLEFYDSAETAEMAFDAA